MQPRMKVFVTVFLLLLVLIIGLVSVPAYELPSNIGSAMSRISVWSVRDNFVCWLNQSPLNEMELH